VYLLTSLGQVDSTLFSDSPPSYTLSQSSTSTSPSPNDIGPLPDRSKLTTEILKSSHPTRHPSLNEIPGGVAQSTLDDWQSIKKEIGIGCQIIDNALNASGVDSIGKRRHKHESHGGRFYNIYNTYIYGETGISPAASLPIYIVGGAIVGFLAIQPFLPVTYLTPGMPNYADRIGWNTANTLSPRGMGFDENSRSTTIGFFRMLLGGLQIVAGRPRPMTPI
jgi:hypothetical protein